jgi:hypothetical protein
MEVVKKDEKKETSWYEIGSLLFKIIYTVLYNGCFLWLGVNLFLVAFAIPFHLTILQAVATCFLFFVIFGILGIGDYV